jgi:hypothetical protein
MFEEQFSPEIQPAGNYKRPLANRSDAPAKTGNHHVSVDSITCKSKKSWIVEMVIPHDRLVTKIQLLQQMA